MADQGLPDPGRFITDALVNLYQSRIKNLISDGGRNVVFTLVPLETDCPNCGWDYMLNRSNGIYTSNGSGVTLNKSFPNGQRCPVCKGKGRLSFQRTQTYKSLIGFAPPPEEFDYVAFGLVPTQVFRLKNTVAIAEDLDKAQYAKIDGLECEKIAFVRRTGLRDIAFIQTYWKVRNT